jgi:hypothetical protein
VTKCVDEEPAKWRRFAGARSVPGGAETGTRGS